MMWRVFPEDKPHTALRFRVIFKCKMTIQVTPVVYDCLMSKMEEYKSGDKFRISDLFRKGFIKHQKDGSNFQRHCSQK